MRDAREDLPFDLGLRDDLLVGGRVLTSALQDRLHRELLARIGARDLEHLPKPALAEHLPHLEARRAAVEQEHVDHRLRSFRRLVALSAVETSEGDGGFADEHAAVRLDQRVGTRLQQ